jgi:hypothetical protein
MGTALHTFWSRDVPSMCFSRPRQVAGTEHWHYTTCSSTVDAQSSPFTMISLARGEEVLHVASGVSRSIKAPIIATVAIVTGMIHHRLYSIRFNDLNVATSCHSCFFSAQTSRDNLLHPYLILCIHECLTVCHTLHAGPCL